MNIPSCCIGQTKQNGKVYVTQSQWTDIPHFTFVTVDDKMIDLQIERAVRDYAQILKKHILP